MVCGWGGGGGGGQQKTGAVLGHVITHLMLPLVRLQMTARSVLGIAAIPGMLRGSAAPARNSPAMKSP